MLKQPPCISSSEILRVRAFSESCASSTDSCTMFFRSASRITGTSRPRSVSTATPMFTYFLTMISSAAMSIDALNCGNTWSAAATTFTAIAVTVRLPPAASTCFAYFLRSSSSPVMSARSHCVTCGIVAQAALRCSAVLRRTARIGCRSTSPQRLKSGSAARHVPLAQVAGGGDQTLRVALDVLDRDAPVGPGALHFADLDAELARHPPHRRRGRGRRLFGASGVRGAVSRG